MWHACMACRLSSSWSMQVAGTNAQMLERCAVLRRDTFSVGQINICHRFSIQIEYQYISKECVTKDCPDEQMYYECCVSKDTFSIELNGIWHECTQGIRQGVCTRNLLRSVHKESTKECAQGLGQGVCTIRIL